MRRFALILLLWPGFVAADEFQQLTGDEILMALAGKKLDYGEGITQTFDSNMQTLLLGLAAFGFLGLL